MRKRITDKRGLDLQLAGALENHEVFEVHPQRVAVTPDDFPGLSLKMLVREGDLVHAGEPIMHDKRFTDINIVSPATGEIEAIVRGPRRKIERVVVSVEHGPVMPFETEARKVHDPETLRLLLMHCGIWTAFRRRPYDIVPLPTDKPRDIFVTAMDTAPLAASLELLTGDSLAFLPKGVEVMKNLTTGHIYIGVDDASTIPDIPGAEIFEFNKLHPMGLPGVQMAHIAPLNKGEVVWTMSVFTLAKIGEMFSNSVQRPGILVAVTGSEVEHPRLVRTLYGSEVRCLVEGNLRQGAHHVRFISGNVLTGKPVGIDGFMRFPYRQLTVIPEGDDADEFLGWARPGTDKMSVSPSILGHYLRRKFSPDARLNGGRRAMIQSGQYDKVLPMDILPEYLFKAINARDIDKMEQLGIYEIAPEDVALCEYVDPSKLELQKLVRDGLDYMRNETE